MQFCGIIQLMEMRKLVSVIFVCITFAPLYGMADYSIILKRNIFAEPPPPPKPPAVPEKNSILKPAPPPSLDSLIELKGIIYFPGGSSFAVIKGKKKNEEVVYKEGDIVENAEILKVTENEVVFLYNGKEERIELKKDLVPAGTMEVGSGVSAMVPESTSSQVNGQVFNPVAVVAPEFKEPLTVDFEKTIADLKGDKELIKNLNVAPLIQEGKVDGFRVSNIPSGSLPYKYGFRDGDVLRRVNGIFIDSMAKGFSVYNQIVKEKTSLVTVEVLRNSAPIVLTFRLK